MRTAPLLALMVLSALACGGGEPAAPPVAPPPAEPPAAAPAAPPPAATPAPAAVPAAPAAPAHATTEKTFAEAAFACCDSERPQNLLRDYLQFQEALVAGKQANGELTAIAGGAKGSMKLGSFSAEDRAALEEIARQAEAMLPMDLEGKRTAFKQLSATAIPFFRRHAGGSRKVAEAYCPMADGAWLQTATTISNPYYGDKMLTCGSFR